MSAADRKARSRSWTTRSPATPEKTRAGREPVDRRLLSFVEANSSRKK
jgi:hypothetical protein